MTSLRWQNHAWTTQAQFAAAQAGLAHFELLAPFAGVVVDIQTKVGEVIGAGTPAILLADFSQWYVDTNDLTELEVVNLSIGQTAVIRADAMPEVVLTGEVVDISEMFTSQSGYILYPVRILVNDPDPRLMWGMTVEIEFNNE